MKEIEFDPCGWPLSATVARLLRDYAARGFDCTKIALSHHNLHYFERELGLAIRHDGVFWMHGAQRTAVASDRSYLVFSSKTEEVAVLLKDFD